MVIFEEISSPYEMFINKRESSVKIRITDWLKIRCLSIFKLIQHKKKDASVLSIANLMIRLSEHRAAV